MDLWQLSGTSISFGVPAESDEKRPAPSTESLDAYALERWEVWMDGSRRIFLQIDGFLDCSALHGFFRDRSDAR